MLHFLIILLIKQPGLLKHLKFELIFAFIVFQSLVHFSLRRREEDEGQDMKLKFLIMQLVPLLLNNTNT